MTVIATILFWAAWGLVVAAAAYLLLAIGCVAGYRAAPAPRPAGRPAGIALLKPLCGMEDGLDAALRSFLSQEADGPVHHVFGVADAQDPALALARRIAAEYPHVRASFVVDPRVHGPNPKVSNLVNMAAVAKGEIVVVSDSDIVAPSGALRAAVDALAAPGVGAVTALYRARPMPAAGRAGVLGALFIDGWFLPTALVHARLVPLAVTYGPLTAIRRETLAAIGGLPALADSLSDDAELGRLVRAQGLSVAFAPVGVETLVNDATLRELFAHELRWARTVRGLDPLGYAASVVTHPGPVPLLLALASPGWATAGAAAGLVALRWLLLALVHARFGRAPTLPRTGPLAIWWRDQLCFAVWLAGAVVRRVSWRGHRLAVVAEARLEA